MVSIVPAARGDAAEIAAIYAHHVLNGTASYETVPPGTADMAARMDKVLEAGWPWLVARSDAGEMLGYAYASQFRDRAAYRYACENSIYVRHDCRGQGVGKQLMAELLRACAAFGFRQMIAVIGGAEPASVALHAALGFEHAGRMKAIGRKQGRWLDNVYMQVQLGEGAATPPAEEPE